MYQLLKSADAKRLIVVCTLLFWCACIIAVRIDRTGSGYDLALLLSCAGTGLLLGYLSLVDVQEIVARRFRPIIGWIFAVVSLVLSGFAIYLGRFLRWNSWDVLYTPTLVLDIAAALMNPLAHLKPLSVTLVFGIILALGYISLRLLFAHPIE